jgi:5,10-methylene-tetrahydrofolate dehydrogenase/methenyl tetrahydrofolate cyclohydrolase
MQAAYNILEQSQNSTSEFTGYIHQMSTNDIVSGTLIADPLTEHNNEMMM